MSIGSWDLENVLVRNSNYESRQIYQIFDEIENNIIKQVNNNPRQLLFPFHKLCLKLFDRLFGEDTTVGIGLSLSSPWVKGETGGWLRKLIIHNDSNINNQSNNNNLNVTYNNKIVSILLPNNNLLNLLSFSNNLTNPIDRTNYEMKLTFLPQKVIMAFKKTSNYSLVKSSNHSVYFDLLQIPLNQQSIHINSMTKDPTFLLEPKEYFIICLIRYPTTSEIVFTPTILSNSNQISSTLRMKYLSMSSKLPIDNNVSEWIKPYPYLLLIKQYFELYLPVNNLSFINNDDEKFGKLFLSMICDFWLDTTIIVRQNFYLINQFKSNYNQKNNIGSNRYNDDKNNKVNKHPSPVDVIVFDGGYTNRTNTSLQCVYLLLIHLLSNLTLSEEFKSSTSLYYQELKKSNFQIENLKFLPKYFQIIQQPLYDMIRSIFNRPDLNVNEDATFYITLEIWLLYIFPWKANSISQKGISKCDGRYISSIWKPYIASNLHFYTTLLVIILKPLSRLDLSIKSFDDMKKINKLIRIFNELSSDDLWDDINTLSSDFRRWYSKCINHSNQSLNTTSLGLTPSIEYNLNDSYDNTFITSEIELYAIKGQHYNLYPDRSIDLLDDCGIISIPYYTKDSGKQLLYIINKIIQLYSIKEVDITNRWFISNLLSTIFIQLSIYTNKILEFLELKLPNKQLSILQKAEICKTCHNLMNQIVFILDIDLTTIDLNNSNDNMNYINMNSNIIDYNLIKDKLTNKLTDYGKKKLLQGKYIFDNYNNLFYNTYNHGDILFKPMKSYEVKPLTKYLVKLSKYLNDLYHLPIKSERNLWSWQLIFEDAFKGNWYKIPIKIIESIRINLRFLSDIRNLFLIFVMIICHVIYYQWYLRWYISIILILLYGILYLFT